MEAYYSMGIDGYLRLQDLNIPIFLDLKLHDIPNTVKSAIKSLIPLNPFMVNVHISGGSEMLREAVGAIHESKGAKPKLVGVTILTSMNESSFEEQGIKLNIQDQVINLATLAADCGLDGVVCSPHEASKVKSKCGEDFLTVVPGIRLEKTQSDDQKRTLTPHEAVRNGADILVVGRPLTKANDPLEVAKIIRKSIDSYAS
jgi:orotidine-5'-phosphate decarboxylase